MSWFGFNHFLWVAGIGWGDLPLVPIGAGVVFLLYGFAGSQHWRLLDSIWARAIGLALAMFFLGTGLRIGYESSQEREREKARRQEEADRALREAPALVERLRSGQLTEEELRRHPYLKAFHEKAKRVIPKDGR